MKYLLDTNAWLRLYLSPDQLAPAVLGLLLEEEELGLSPFSLIEVAQKVAKGRLVLGQPLEEWLGEAIPPQIQLLGVGASVAVKAYQFEDFHGDPADRVIGATAVVYDLMLVTSDRLLIKHPEVPTVDARP